MLLSYIIVGFHLFYDGAVDNNMSPSDKKSVSDTQVTVKNAQGLLLSIKWPLFT